MLNYILKEPKHESFYKKYASKKFLKVGVHKFLPTSRFLIPPLGQRIRARVGAGAMATRWPSPTLGTASHFEGGDSPGEGQGDRRRRGCRRTLNASPMITRPCLSITYLPRWQSTHLHGGFWAPALLPPSVCPGRVLSSAFRFAL